MSGNGRTISRDGGRIARRMAWVPGVAAAGLAVFALVTGGEWSDALERGRRAGKVSVEDFVHWGMWWAALVNAVLCAALGVWLARGGGPGARASGPGSQGLSSGAGRHPSGGGRLGWLWICGILAVAVALRWPRMGLSFYNDEASTFRRCIAGQHQRKGEEVRWRQVKWVETWFGDQNGNNSPPCSVLGRVCYDSWKRLSQAEDGAVCEPAVRLPQLIAGLGGLVFVWLVGRRIGGAGVGIAAALVLAIHPWHVRYSTEARGYGLLLLAVPAAFYFLARGLEDGRWRWWLGCGMAQGLCAWAFPGAVYFLAVFNVLALAVTARGRMGTRLLVGSACGGMVALQLMLPVAPQLLEAIKKIPSMKGAMPLSWWGNVGAGLLCGVRGADEDPGNPNNLALARLAGPHGWLWLLVIAGALLGLAGMVMLVRRGGAASVVALAGPGSVLLSWVASRAQGNFLHPWYELAALPGLALGAGAVLAAVARGPAIRALLLTVVAGPLAAALLAIDLRLMDTGKENLRGVADALRQPGALVATMYSDVDVYLPEVRFLAPGRAVQDLRALVARARSERRTLWFEGRTALLASVAPELRRELEEGGDFEGERVFCGLEEQQFTHEIFRLRDGP